MGLPGEARPEDYVGERLMPLQSVKNEQPVILGSAVVTHEHEDCPRRGCLLRVAHLASPLYIGHTSK